MLTWERIDVHVLARCNRFRLTKSKIRRLRLVAVREGSEVHIKGRQHPRRASNFCSDADAIPAIKAKFKPSATAV